MLKYYDEIESIHIKEMHMSYFDKTEKQDYIIPNAYYINSSGLLYNSFGDDGHKEANLLYAYKLIKDYFFDVRYVGITKEDGIPSLQRKLKEELKAYKRIVKTNRLTLFDALNYFHITFCDLNDPLIIKLALGIITSEIILLNKFIELEKKVDNKKDAIEKIIELSNDDIKDILVRFCGFHKIETNLSKTITTSSLDLNSFINYFDNGWTIDIVPKILLNEEEDKFYRTLVLDNFLKKNPQYSNKVKMKI